MTTSNTGAGRNPFVGPLPLETGQRIFGRDREIEELYYLLSAERIVLLHSPSGAGKSSLIRAGLIPRLAERFDVRGPTRVNTRPLEGATVNRYVRSANLGFEQGLPEERRRADELVSSMTLAEYVEGRPRRRSAPPNVALIFDQFEEILAADPLAFDAKREFFRQLGELLRNHTIWALFALREDYLAQLDPYSDQIPTHLKNRFRMDLLSRTAAQEVMLETAKMGGRTFAQHAVESLVTDLATMKVQQPDGSFQSQAGPHVEPLHLQVACRGLWERMPAEHETIDSKDVERFGNVTDALAFYYGNSVAGLADRSDVVERAIREWMDNRLITPDGVRSQVLKGKDKSEGLDNELISELVNTHLIRAEQRAGATWFELSHDRLIEPVRVSNRQWFNTKLHSFQKIATVWEAQQRPDELLFVSSALEEAERWAEANAALVTYSERSFLKKSHERRLAARMRQLAYSALVVILLSTIAALLAYIFEREIRETYYRRYFTKFVRTQESERALKRGDRFRECAKDCPEMIVIPPGEFWMGSRDGEGGPREYPRRKVTVDKPFAVGRYEVTWDDWDACVWTRTCPDIGVRYSATGSDPVFNVSWDDARVYVQWLSRMTGQPYRLLSEAEWEYAARGITSTDEPHPAYPWGDKASHDYANYGDDECCEAKKEGRDQWDKWAPVGQFPPNAFGLHDMHGNVWEWVEDLAHGSYVGAPPDGKAWIKKGENGVEYNHVVRGGSWSADPYNIRSANREWDFNLIRHYGLGFRVARDLAS